VTKQKNKEEEEVRCLCLLFLSTPSLCPLFFLSCMLNIYFHHCVCVWRAKERLGLGRRTATQKKPFTSETFCLLCFIYYFCFLWIVFCGLFFVDWLMISIAKKNLSPNSSLILSSTAQHPTSSTTTNNNKYMCVHIHTHTSFLVHHPSSCSFFFFFFLRQHHNAAFNSTTTPNQK